MQNLICEIRNFLFKSKFYNPLHKVQKNILTCVLKAAARTHYNSREQVNPFSISGAIGRLESTHTRISVCVNATSLRRCMRFSRCSRVVRRHARCHTCCLPAGLPLKINHLVLGGRNSCTANYRVQVELLARYTRHAEKCTFLALGFSGSCALRRLFSYVGAFKECARNAIGYIKQPGTETKPSKPIKSNYSFFTL